MSAVGKCFAGCLPICNNIVDQCSSLEKIYLLVNFFHINPLFVDIRGSKNSLHPVLPLVALLACVSLN